MSDIIEGLDVMSEVGAVKCLYADYKEICERNMIRYSSSILQDMAHSVIHKSRVRINGVITSAAPSVVEGQANVFEKVVKKCPLIALDPKSSENFVRCIYSHRMDTDLFLKYDLTNSNLLSPMECIYNTNCHSIIQYISKVDISGLNDVVLLESFLWRVLDIANAFKDDGVLHNYFDEEIYHIIDRIIYIINMIKSWEISCKMSLCKPFAKLTYYNTDTDVDMVIERVTNIININSVKMGSDFDEDKILTLLDHIGDLADYFIDIEYILKFIDNAGADFDYKKLSDMEFEIISLVKTRVVLKTIPNLDIDEFSEYQVLRLVRGIMEGLDISKYANPEYSLDQMDEIMLDLRSGICYADYPVTMSPEHIRERRLHHVYTTDENFIDPRDIRTSELCDARILKMCNIQRTMSYNISKV